MDPSSCFLTPVVKIPTDPESSVLPAAAAFDPVTNTFVLTLSQARGKAAAGPVLVAVDMGTGNVTHTLRESARNLTIISLVNSGPGRFLGLSFSAYPDPAYPGVFLVSYDSDRNAVRKFAHVPGVTYATPNLAAREDDIFYFITSAAGMPSIVGLFAANGTVASTAQFPGDASQAPSAFFHL